MAYSLVQAQRVLGMGPPSYRPAFWDPRQALRQVVGAFRGQSVLPTSHSSPAVEVQPVSTMLHVLI